MKKILKKWWFWVLVVVLFVLILPLSDGDNGSSVVSTDSLTGSESLNSSSVEQKFYIGDKILTSRDILFQVVSVENTKRIGGSYLYEETENNFIVIVIKIENRSNNVLDLDYTDFVLTNGEKEYEGQISIYLDNNLLIEEINPDTTKTYSLLFETGSTTLEMDYVLETKLGLLVVEKIKVNLKNKE